MALFRDPNGRSPSVYFPKTDTWGKFSGGLYETSDPDEIATLDANPNYFRMGGDKEKEEAFEEPVVTFEERPIEGTSDALKETVPVEPAKRGRPRQKRG